MNYKRMQISLLLVCLQGILVCSDDHKATKGAAQEALNMQKALHDGNGVKRAAQEELNVAYASHDGKVTKRRKVLTEAEIAARKFVVDTIRSMDGQSEIFHDTDFKHTSQNDIRIFSEAFPGQYRSAVCIKFYQALHDLKVPKSDKEAAEIMRLYESRRRYGIVLYQRTKEEKAQAEKNAQAIVSSNSVETTANNS